MSDSPPQELVDAASDMDAKIYLPLESIQLERGVSDYLLPNLAPL